MGIEKDSGRPTVSMGAFHQKRELKDYRKLSSEDLNKFDVCLWLCGHSSVKQSIDNPSEAFSNNTTGLIELSKKFDGTIIYASSGSVYNNSTGLCDENELIYNASTVLPPMHSDFPAHF